MYLTDARFTNALLAFLVLGVLTLLAAGLYDIGTTIASLAAVPLVTTRKRAWRDLGVMVLIAAAITLAVLALIAVAYTWSTPTALSLATAPVFLRLPKSPWVTITDSSGNTRRVPQFVNLRVDQIAAFGAGPDDDQGRSTTLVVMENGQRTLLSTFEDEVAYILSESLGAISLVTHDYREHQADLANFRERITIRSNGSSPDQPKPTKTAAEHAAAGTDAPF